MATNQYGQKYSGNDDFRGFLAATNQNYLPFVGNDGGVNRTAAAQNIKGAQGNFVSKLSGFKNVDQFAGQISQIYQQWQAGRQAVASGGGGGGYSSGGGAAKAAVDPAELAYYDDQVQQAENSLGRLGNQQNIGFQNIDQSYNSGMNTLNESKAVADRDLGIARDSTITGNIEARGKINRSVNNASTGLVRLLGSIGAGNSSASRILAPYAVAKQGTTQAREVQSGFAGNMQKLDIQKGDQDRQYNNSITSLNQDKENKRNALQAGIEQQRASILQSIGGFKLAKAQANNQNYAQARSAAQPYTNQVNSILANVDNLARQSVVNPVTGVKYTAPELAAYDPAGISVDAAPGTDAVEQSTSPFYSLIQSSKKKKALV